MSKPRWTGFAAAVLVVAAAVAFAQPGNEVKMQVIDSPPWPPVGVVRPVATSIPASAVLLSQVPTSTWTYGCSATAAGMMFAYYDRTGYRNMYTGPTNGGVCPLTDLGQGADPANPIPGSCYIIATMNGFDGYTVKGHVDDYWISYGSPGPDPWEGNWTEHSWADCTADFMGTNQWKWDWDLNGFRDGNSDGTTIFFYNTNGTKLYDYIPPAAHGLPQTELCHGMRLFAESRGYTVVQNYTQLIDAVKAGGFSFTEYKAEIDAGRPVMIQLEGHSMAGVGYDLPNIVYLHDTWDNLVHTMTWGGMYAGMSHFAMTVIELEPPPPEPVEHGAVWAGSSWTTVLLTQPFTDPIVVAGPATSIGWAPGVVRVRNVTPTSFQIRFQEWDYLDGWHTSERIHCIVIDRGTYDLGGGKKLIADRFLTNKTNVNLPRWVAFPEAFSETPVVLTQVQSYSGSDAVTDRICGVYPGGMQFSMQEQESKTDGHCNEMVGYIAVSPGVTDLLGVLCNVKRTAAVVTHNPYMLAGSEGHAVVRIREEQSWDAETLHWAAEKVGFIALAGQPVVIADMQTCNGADPCELRCTLLSQVLAWEDGVVAVDHQWQTVNLAGTYISPVVLAGPATYTGAAPGEVRVRNVTADSFQIRFQEWDYLDGWHCYEQIHWWVIERGVWDAGSGDIWIADKFPTENANVYSPSWVTLPLALDGVDLVLATQQTANGSSCVTERISNIWLGGFSVALQEEEAADAIHVEENLGYFVWGSGTGGLSAASAAADIQAVQLGSAQVSGVTPAASWYVYIVEEQSKDAETWHCAEWVAGVVFPSTPLMQPPFILDMDTCLGVDPCSLRCKYVLTAAGAQAPSGPGARGVKRVPVAVVGRPGDVLTLTAPQSLVEEGKLWVFSHWEVDGEPCGPGLPTIKIEMGANREAVAVYGPLP